MDLVWPWTVPSASATLARYLVGVVVQFSFELYASRKISHVWLVIPIIFQVSIKSQVVFSVVISLSANGIV